MSRPRRWDRGSPAGPRPSAGAGGRSPIPRPAWRTDHPSAGAPEFRPRTWRGRSRGLPRRTLEDKGVRTGAKSFLRYPARHGGQAGQASGGRRRRPSRAFFAPRALRSWPSGASPDALLLLSHPRAVRRREAGAAAEHARQWQSIGVAPSSFFSPAVVVQLSRSLSASSPSANSGGRLPGIRPRGGQAPSARCWCRAPWRPSCRRRAGGPCLRGPCRSPRR